VIEIDSRPDIHLASIIPRFVLTRLWFWLSIGGHGQELMAQANSTVVDAQELVKGEIWSVAVLSSLSSSADIFYVLESTCEVVGHPSLPLNPTECSTKPIRSGCSIPVRADWSAYIAHRLSTLALHDTPPSLLAHLKWTNHEEYNKGISKLWSKRILNEGSAGAAKMVVAERYVLACVVGNRYDYECLSSKDLTDLLTIVSVALGCHRPRWRKNFRVSQRK
jgi:hypothetical protein